MKHMLCACVLILLCGVLGACESDPVTQTDDSSQGDSSQSDLSYSSTCEESTLNTTVGTADGTTIVCRQHDYEPATCEKPETCKLCGATRGEPAHQWKGPFCNLPKHCGVCGFSDSEELGEHMWAAANCQNPEICFQCGLRRGEPSNEHRYREANCLSPQICDDCGVTNGEPNEEHVWKEPGCAPKYCEICDLQVGESPGLPHKWTGGNCFTKQHCSECGAIDNKKVHDYNDMYTCKLCGYCEYSYGLAYKPYGEGYQVVGLGSCDQRSIKIPETYKGKPVVSIGENALVSEKGQFTSCTVPKTVTHIGTGAFAYCQYIHYSSTLEDWAKIQKDVRIVNTKDAEYIENITYNLGYYLFIDGSRVDTLVVPESMTEIPDYAFAGINANNIVLHDKVTKIGRGAFLDIDSTGNEGICLILPRSAVEIQDYAFYYSSVLTKIVVPNTVQIVGDYAIAANYLFVEHASKPRAWSTVWGDYDIGCGLYWKGQWEYVDGVPTVKP